MPALPIDLLLPLRCAVVTLRFLEPAAPPFFHQPALAAFLRHLAGSPESFERLIRFDAPESGRIAYAAGQYYRFLVVGLAGGEAILATLLASLARLPGASPRTDFPLPFRDNLILAAVQDAFTGESVVRWDGLSGYGPEALDAEAAGWNGRAPFHWQFVAPARLLKDKSRRQGTAGEARYCRNLADLDGALLAARLHDSLAELLRSRGQVLPPRPAPPSLRIADGHLFWLDAGYTDDTGAVHQIGGMSGRLQMEFAEPPSTDWWRQAVLGQYLGFGQRGAFGLGRYRLESPDGEASCQRVLPALSLLSLAREEANLAAAWLHIRANQRDRRAGLEAEEEWGLAGGDTALAAGENTDEMPLERLQQALDRALSGEYRPPPLVGLVLPKPNGGVRPLAVPPFFDRVLQRAVAQVLAPALEAAQYRHSYGFRAGRSRQGARDAIQRAAREGYRWVYESDVEDFFDSVDLSRLGVRLRSLYGDDPAVDLVLAWMARPVEYAGETIQRPVGLPQGSPLSPALANLMLDDFDGDMEVQGFRLVRFADDFVVLCKSPGEAERAHAAAAASLAEHGLGLNSAKTRIAPTEQGFRYLGYLFVNDLAVDVSGRAEDSKGGRRVPPKSWLAHLGARQPVPLSEGQAPSSGGAEPLSRGPALAFSSPAAASPELPVTVGELGKRGQLLCVTGEHASLSTHGGRLRVERADEIVTEAPWTHLHAVLLFGAHTVTTPALQAALKHGVPIHFAGAGGGYRGVLWTGQPAEPGAGLWLRQASLFADPELALGLAREIVAARIRHLRETLRLRGATEAADRMKAVLGQVDEAAGLDILNGLEGTATRELFQAVAAWLPPIWGFTGRNRQPPRDPFNVLLSVGYTLLRGYVETLLHADGLLPWLGFYHQAHGRHAVLTSDLMEPFRHLVERTALSTIQRREVQPDNFQFAADGACLMKSAPRRNYLARLAERFNVPLAAYDTDVPLSPLEHIHRQNLSLIRWLQAGENFQAWRTR